MTNHRRLSPSTVLCIAAVLFLSASGTLVAVAWQYAKDAPGLVLVIVSILATGALVWYTGWRAVRAGELARGQLEAQARALHQSEARYRSSFDHAVFGILRVALDGTILTANPALARMLGYGTETELVNRNVADLYVYATERDRLQAELRAHKAVSGVQLHWKTRDGRQIFVRVTSRVDRAPDGRPIEFEKVVEDVTERAVLGEQLRQAQKMEAVGRLAGGVAHDFNNLLTVILGNTEILAQERVLSPDGVHCLDEIRNATESAAAVTRQLLVLTRKSAAAPEQVDPNELVTRVERLIARLIGEDIRVNCRLHADAGTVLVDREQLQQALINLAVNARDAMPTGGILTFETSVSPDGRSARLAVGDTGHGMDDLTKQRIFEPFFTTKAPGKGTGLGLSMVYAFVRNSGGTIRVDSAVGEGTTLTMELPRLTVAASATRDDDAAPHVSIQGTECVLVVEDQRAVRSMVGGVLRARGFSVFQAENANAARQVLAKTERVDLVLSDIVMPGESGIELAGWLRATHPHIGVMLMSGYSDHPALHAVPLPNNVPVLQKPFTPTTLLAHLRSTLDSRSATSARELSATTTG
jgi:two-component system cell cycle sensor histidine kinase/response regulator CckA